MDLVIQIVDGKPYQHPMALENLRMLMPDANVSFDNLPPGYAKFIRVLKPRKCGLFQVEECHYDWVDGVVKDIWVARDMTPEERSNRQQELYVTAVRHKASNMQFAQKQIDEATSDEDRQVWQTYFDALAATELSLQKYSMPVFPRKNAQGLWINNNLSGSMPNVTG